MNNYKKKKGFTIAELTIALMLIAFISMILMPIVFSDSKKQVLMAALNKNYTALQEVHQNIPMLQARGKISPGSINTDIFMQAVVLTHTAIGLNSDGTIATVNKYPQYIAGYTTNPTNLLANYTQFSLTNPSNTTIILKNGVYISKYTESSTNYIMIDINGKKTPNKTGEDIFFFEISDRSTQGTNKGISWNNSVNVIQPVNSSNCKLGGNFANSSGCAKRYIETGKMN